MKKIFALALCATSVALPAAAQVSQTPGDVINLSPPPPIASAAPQAAPSASNTKGTISLQQAQMRKPLRYIEVEELPPIPSQLEMQGADADTEVLSEEDLTDPNNIAADEYFISSDYRYVTLHGIHKLTGRAEKLRGPVGQVLVLGQLEVIAHKCSSILDHGERGFASLVEILEQEQTDAQQAYFRGWLFSTSPSLSSIGHTQYDVLLASCSNEENADQSKAKPDAPEEKSTKTSPDEANSKTDSE